MNLTSGTDLWAIQQLLAGKKIACVDFPRNEYIHIVDGKLLDESNIEQSLDIFGDANTDWQLWFPPNLYTIGTFPWAWEELNRGKHVSVHEAIYTGDKPLLLWKDGTVLFAQHGDKETPWSAETVHVALIKSTNWKLV